MEKAYSIFAQSKFFTSAFNSAIYDGPVRIYFSQAHESAGLSVYFGLVKKHPESIKRLKELSKVSGENVYLLIYPDEEHFSLSFGTKHDKAQSFEIANLAGHRVVGIKSPEKVENLEPIVNDVVQWIEMLSAREPAPLVADL